MKPTETSTPQPSRILIIGPSWVGDMVMAQVLFKHLSRNHPQATIDVLAPPWTLPLLKHMPEINKAIANPFPHGVLALRERYRLGRSLRTTGYDWAIVLPNSLKSALVPFFARIPRRTGFVGEARWGLLNDARRLDRKRLPLMVQRFLHLGNTARSASLPPPQNADEAWTQRVPGDLLPRLHVTSAQREETRATLGLDTERPAVAFCIGAEYGPAKRWPPGHFAELARRLHNAGYQIWLVGSPKDAALGEEIAASAPGQAVNLCGRTSLDQAIHVLSLAEQVVANDSGLMHIAAALDRPMLALYGSSSPRFTPPLSRHARTISLHLACSPCFERQCPLGHFNCMIQMTPERVLAELAERGEASGVDA